MINAPILGVTKLERLQDALRAINVTLSDKDVERIELPPQSGYLIQPA